MIISLNDRVLILVGNGSSVTVSVFCYLFINITLSQVPCCRHMCPGDVTSQIHVSRTEVRKTFKLGHNGESSDYRKRFE